MGTTTATVRATRSIEHTAARLSYGAAAISLVLLVVLHVLSPEFDPSWRMVSEYALGRFGWALTLMFCSLALSCAALFVAIRSAVTTLAGRVGLGFLLAAVVGMLMAALFDWQHNLHGLAAMIGNPGFVIAAPLISLGLARVRPWSSARRLLLWTAHLPWISFALLLATLFSGLSRSGGSFGPDVLIGWPNRLLLVTYGLWLMVIAHGAARRGRGEPA
jgi:hypothetical protein